MNWLCCSCVISTVVPMFNLKGSAIYFCLEIKIFIFHIRSRAKRWFLTGSGRINIGCYCFDLLWSNPDGVGCHRWKRYLDIISLSLHVSPVFYLFDLISAKQFCGQQGLPDPHILSAGIDQNDRHTPCLHSGHKPINHYARRQVVVLSLLH